MNPCAGERTVKRVTVEHFERADGEPDRKITVERDCGHPYFAGRRLDDDPPKPGERAMQCPGPVDITPVPRPADMTEPIFDEHKRPAKRRRAK